MKQTGKQSTTARSARLRMAGVAAVTVAVTIGVVGGAISAQAGTAVHRSHKPGAGTLAPSASAMRHARWVTLHGKRVLVAPVSRAAAANAANSGIPWGTLKNAGSGLCMSSYPDTVGAGVEQFPCTGSYNQEWVLVHDGPGWGLMNQGMVSNTSQGTENGCLDNRGGVIYSDGNPQIMWPCYGAGWNQGLNYGEGLAQTSGTQLLHTNDWNYHNGQTWCVTSYPNTAPGTTLSEWVCNKYSLNQSFYGTVTYY
jgi:hypothetical protein